MGGPESGPLAYTFPMGNMTFDAQDPHVPQDDPRASAAPGLAVPAAEPDIDPAELRASALRQARRLVEFYRITAEELSDTPSPAESTVQPEEAAQSCTQPARPVKYRHPVTGDTWDGVGPHPDWMRQALLKDGYRVAELLVESSTSAF